MIPITSPIITPASSVAIGNVVDLVMLSQIPCPEQYTIKLIQSLASKPEFQSKEKIHGRFQFLYKAPWSYLVKIGHIQPFWRGHCLLYQHHQITNTTSSVITTQFQGSNLLIIRQSGTSKNSGGLVNSNQHFPMEKCNTITFNGPIYKI